MTTESEVAAAERAATIQDVRAILDWLEATPVIPLPFFSFNAFVLDRKSFRAVAKAIGGTVEKRYFDDGEGGGFVALTKMFGGLRFDVNIQRDKVCTRRVVGVRTIPEQIKEIVEWDCMEIPEQESV